MTFLSDWTCDIKIKELLTDRSKWTQHLGAIDSSGEVIDPRSDKACRWCLYGALLKCYGYGDESISVLRALEDGISPSPDELHLIVLWNDAPGRTFQEVKDLVERLDV